MSDHIATTAFDYCPALALVPVPDHSVGPVGPDLDDRDHEAHSRPVLPAPEKASTSFCLPRSAAVNSVRRSYTFALGSTSSPSDRASPGANSMVTLVACRTPDSFNVPLAL